MALLFVFNNNSNANNIFNRYHQLHCTIHYKPLHQVCNPESDKTKTTHRLNRLRMMILLTLQKLTELCGVVVETTASLSRSFVFGCAGTTSLAIARGVPSSTALANLWALLTTIICASIGIAYRLP